MGKWGKLIRAPRIWVFLIVLILFVIAISPNFFTDGVVIKAVTRNSSAAAAGLESPPGTTRPLSLERVQSVNGKAIHTIDDWYAATANLPGNRTMQLQTNKQAYRVLVLPQLEVITSNETDTSIVQEIVQQNVTVNGTVLLQNVSVNRTIETPRTLTRVNGSQPLGIAVAPVPTSNLRKGLDLQGGIRVLLEPTEAVSDDTFGLVIDSLKQRLNVYGLSDVTVTSVGDLSGHKYILVELAGATEQQARDLLSKQGKFEATIGNITVFSGGNDITYVCRTSTCSGIDPNRGCGQSPNGGYSCAYYFSIALSPEAAKRHAEVTKNLGVIGTPPETYLSENLTLWLDNAPVRTLRISSDLKGKETTEVSVSGYGQGVTQQQALANTLDDMKQLQTVLVTGSLPVTLQIARLDSVSPKLGDSFTTNAIITGLLAIAAVVIVCLVRYRHGLIVFPMALTSIAEVVIILGVYALFGASLDLPAIAGIIVSVGTGVDHEVIIVDEALRKVADDIVGWKDRIKRAFFIVFAAFATTGVALLWLWLMGSAMMKGFAITSIAGLIIGVFITRPAFAKYVETMLGD
jgi:preprotein translocase subunit SecD